MLRMAQKHILISVLIMLFLGWFTVPSYAALSMDEIRYLFEKETGAQWDEATSVEKKDFLNDIKGRDEFQKEVEYKGKREGQEAVSDTIEDSILSDQEEEKAPYNVRESFEKARGMAWEAATEEQQKRYWNNYNIKEQRAKQREKEYLQKRDLKEQQREMKQKAKEESLKLKMEKREQQQKRILEEKKRKREEARRKIQEARQKINMLKQKAKNKH